MAKICLKLPNKFFLEINCDQEKLLSQVAAFFSIYVVDSCSTKYSISISQQKKAADKLWELPNSNHGLIRYPPKQAFPIKNLIYAIEATTSCMFLNLGWYFFHASAVWQQNQVTLFSGPSGIGKSTIRKHFINSFVDDSIILIPRRDKYLAYNSPFDTLTKYKMMNRGARINQAYFLKQDTKWTKQLLKPNLAWEFWLSNHVLVPFGASTKNPVGLNKSIMSKLIIIAQRLAKQINSFALTTALSQPTINIVNNE